MEEEGRRRTTSFADAQGKLAPSCSFGETLRWCLLHFPIPKILLTAVGKPCPSSNEFARNPPRRLPVSLQHQTCGRPGRWVGVVL